MKLKRNRVKCLECGKVLESFYGHDYKTCGCPQETMVDGGLEYERYGGHDMDKVQTMFEYVDDEVFLWGVLDRETGELIQHELSDLTGSHIQNIVLHLRTRFAPNKDDITFSDSYSYSYKEFSHKKDNKLLKDILLPELERRGLEEVTEEIPWKD